MSNRLHVWSLASLVVALAGCGGRGCSSSNDRTARRSTPSATPAPPSTPAPPQQGPATSPANAPVLTLTTADASTAQVSTVREGVNLLGVELYGKLREAPGNVIVSPAGVSATLAMATGGARGETLSEMRRVLHHPADERALHQVLGDTVVNWRYGDAGDAGDGGLMRYAQRAWVTEGLTYVDAFIDLTMHAYQASFDRVDFHSVPEAQRRINGWLSGQTDERVDEVVPGEALNDATRMVVAGGLYLRVAWQRRFSLAQTRAEPFAGERSTSVSMMHTAGTFGYAAPEGVRVVELPMRDGNLAMDVILPAEASGFADLERGLTAEKIDQWVAALRPTRVDVALPRFTLHPRLSTPLRAPLEALGMTRAFDASTADFSGVATPRNATDRVSLGAAYHRSTLEVGEYGDGGSAESNAARPTAAGAGAAVRADRPFLFVVRDTRTGLMALIGRVVDPSS